MSRVDAERSLTPSVLDRLLDASPRNPRGPEVSGPTRLGELKEALRRDLEWLLNARRTGREPPSDAPYLRESMLSYGLPDLTNMPLSDEDHRLVLTRAIEQTLKRFEPRLTETRVTLVEEGGTSGVRGLHFRIDGLLRVEPHPEAVSFDSALTLPDHDFEVREA